MCVWPVAFDFLQSHLNQNTDPDNAVYVWKLGSVLISKQGTMSLMVTFHYDPNSRYPGFDFRDRFK